LMGDAPSAGSLLCLRPMSAYSVRGWHFPAERPALSKCIELRADRLASPQRETDDGEGGGGGSSGGRLSTQPLNPERQQAKFPWESIQAIPHTTRQHPPSKQLCARLEAGKPKRPTVHKATTRTHPVARPRGPEVELLRKNPRKWGPFEDMRVTISHAMESVKGTNWARIWLSRQSRNVLFDPGLRRVGAILRAPVKRRWDLLASDSIEEQPAGSHRGR
jgi:hypothetical protein